MVAIRLTPLFTLAALMAMASAASLPSQHIRVIPRQMEGGPSDDGNDSGFNFGLGGWGRGW
ncbi:hypothetical protein IWQ61_001404 [Dispira simplex]|nr:hypothetical protein IWQ61_001404 [Dispira simplex]